MRKVVASLLLTLDGVMEAPEKWNFHTWQNSTLLGDDVAGEVSRLKQQPGKDLSITGSATLVRSLLAEGLLDELRLMIHPIVVGSGRRLFENGTGQAPLELVESKTFTTGVLNLTYPARA